MAENGLPHGYMVPKVRSAADIAKVAARLDQLEKKRPGARGPRWLLPIATELPAAVFELPKIAAAPRVSAITWGCEDLSAEIGATSTRLDDGQYLPVFALVRSATLLAAKAAGAGARPNRSLNRQGWQVLMRSTACTLLSRMPAACRMSVRMQRAWGLTER